MTAIVDLFGNERPMRVRRDRVAPSIGGKRVIRVVRAPQNFYVVNPRKGWCVIGYSPRGEQLAKERRR
jgi:hypothetical protein